MIDSFGRNITYLRVSLTERCNFRCRYCMPEEGICKKAHDDILTEDELISALEAAAELGIKKLRFTGGEPLIKKNILSICERAGKIDGIEEMCITTNGVLLPQFAKPLREAGVTRANISLDTLKEKKFSYITRGGKLAETLAGIEAALDAGFTRIKLNAVLIGGFNEEEIPQLAELTKDRPIDVRFIELMPMTGNRDFGPDAFIPCTTVTEKLPELQPVPSDGSVAQLYRLPNAKGNIGLISPISAHFCKECNRIRLTADGHIKPCLHKEAEYSLKGLCREEMKAQLERAILSKPQWHGELSYSSRSSAGRTMNEIGG